MRGGGVGGIGIGEGGWCWEFLFVGVMFCIY
jgi:hypothetical protein